MVFRTEIAGPAEVSPVFPLRSQIGKVLYTIMGFRDFIMNVAAQLKSSLLNLPAGILIIFTVTFLILRSVPARSNMQTIQQYLLPKHQYYL